MIDFNITTSKSLGDDLRELETLAPRKLYRAIARNIIPPLERKLDRILHNEPPPRTESSPTFVWSRDPGANTRARRWFFFHFPNGYERSHQLVEAWITEIFFKSGDTIISLENAAPGASYVYGDENNEQIPGHRLTGWPEIAEVTVDIVAEYENDIVELYDDIVAGIA